MASARQPVDLLIFIEHVARELDIACILKSRVAKRDGFTTAIASINWDLADTLRRYQPNVVAVPYCYSARPEDPGLYQMLTTWPQAVCVNLAYEQLHPRITQHFNMPRDLVAKLRVLHHAWGTFHAEALQRCGVPAAHVMINGNPSYALYHTPYRQAFESREVLADRYGLDLRKRWVFVPESYGAAFQTDRELNDLVRRGYHAEAAVQHRDFMRASLQTAVQWWQEAADSGMTEIIIRPRPWTPLEVFRRACVRAAGRPLSPHFHLLKEETVREWVLASQVVVSNASTTLIEAAIAEKPVAMLAPLPFPTLLLADWYDSVQKIDRASVFMNFIIYGEPERAGEGLKEWAQRRMLSRGDPIVNLADLLVSIVRRERPIPPGVDLPGRQHLGQRAIAGLRRQWRRKVHERLHEQDRIGPATLRDRCARWETVLDRADTSGNGQRPGTGPPLSIVICTWNPSAEGLGLALESLERQTLERSLYEVIVVDNGPLQRARAMVAARAGQTDLRLRYVHEPTLGASTARTRGVLESRGAIVAFLDDDARAEARWASLILQAYEELPGAGCIGGRILLEGCDATPSWWQESFNELCGELNYGSRRVQVGYPRYPYAGNLSFRRSVFAKVGYFSPALGPVGHRHLDGEEFEQCLRIERAGGTIFFDPSLKVYHAVSRDRLSRRFVLHKAFYHGRTMALIEAGHFGRRFAIWRNFQVRRDLVKRRSTAFARLRPPGMMPEVDQWLANPMMRQRGRVGLRMVAQGLGYSYQTFAHELWRLQRPVVPPIEVVHGVG